MSLLYRRRSISKFPCKSGWKAPGPLRGSLVLLKPVGTPCGNHRRRTSSPPLRRTSLQHARFRSILRSPICRPLLVRRRFRAIASDSFEATSPLISQTARTDTPVLGLLFPRTRAGRRAMRTARCNGRSATVQHPLDRNPRRGSAQRPASFRTAPASCWVRALASPSPLLAPVMTTTFPRCCCS